MLSPTLPCGFKQVEHSVCLCFYQTNSPLFCIIQMRNCFECRQITQFEMHKKPKCVEVSAD